MSASRDDMRLPALDGVRGLAVLLVVVDHLVRLHPNNSLERMICGVASVGWVGVELFFVLSGFLITGILLDAKGADHYFRNFYLRRVLRIFPLYYGTLALMFFVLPHLGVMAPAESRDLLGKQGWYWAYLSNVMTAIAGSWDAIPKLGFHFWSLAVEEQFYMIWPLLIWLVPARRLRGICVGAVVGSLVVRMALRAAGQPGIVSYVLTPTHLDPLAAGAWLAATARRPGGLDRLAAWVWPVLLVSVAGIGVIMLTAHDKVVNSFGMQLLGYPLLATASAALVVGAVTDRAESPISRFWRSAPMGLLGRRSYALYVLHPFLVFFAVRWGFDVPYFAALTGSQLLGQALFAIIMLPVSVGVAIGSWHAYEQPFLRLKSRFPMRHPAPVRSAAPAASAPTLPATSSD